MRVLRRLLVNSVSAKESWFMSGWIRSQIKSARLSHVTDLIACSLVICADQICGYGISATDLGNKAHQSLGNKAHQSLFLISLQLHKIAHIYVIKFLFI